MTLRTHFLSYPERPYKKYGYLAESRRETLIPKGEGGFTVSLSSIVFFINVPTLWTFILGTQICGLRMHGDLHNLQDWRFNFRLRKRPENRQAKRKLHLKKTDMKPSGPQLLKKQTEFSIQLKRGWELKISCSLLLTSFAGIVTLHSITLW